MTGGQRVLRQMTEDFALEIELNRLTLFEHPFVAVCEHEL